MFWNKLRVGWGCGRSVPRECLHPPDKRAINAQREKETASLFLCPIEGGGGGSSKQPPSWFWCLRILATRWLEVLSVSFRILLLMIYRACLCKKQTGRRKNSSPPFYSFVHLRPLYLGTGNHNGQITLARNRESNCLHKMECRPRAVSCRLVKSKRSRNLIIWKPLFSRICIRKGLGGESWNGFFRTTLGWVSHSTLSSRVSSI